MKRCRDILQKLTSLGSGDAPFDRMPLRLLIEEVVEPHRDFGIEIAISLPEDPAGEPVLARNPGLIYGIGNLVENAVDFAAHRVDITAAGRPPTWNWWCGTTARASLRGERPHRTAYVTSRARTPEDATGESGLGLGFFIAKTLLERSGANLKVENARGPEHGATVRIIWPRSALDLEESETDLASNQRTMSPEVTKGSRTTSPTSPPGRVKARGLLRCPSCSFPRPSRIGPS